MGRASKIMAPTSCFNGQVHRLPDAPEAYGAMITRPKAAPAQSRYADPSLISTVAMWSNDHRADRHVIYAANKGEANPARDAPVQTGRRCAFACCASTNFVPSTG